MTKVKLTHAQYRRIFKKINGHGGMQSLLKKIKKQTSIVVELSDADVERVIRYTHRYGTGGFQYRLAELRMEMRS